MVNEFRIDFTERKAILMAGGCAIKVVEAKEGEEVSRPDQINALLFWLRNEVAMFHDGVVRGA